MKRGWMIGMAAGILAGLIAGCGAAGGGKAESVPEPSAAQAAETEPVTVQVRVLCENARAEVELELPEGVSYDRSWEAELFDVTEGREKERLGTVRGYGKWFYVTEYAAYHCQEADLAEEPWLLRAEVRAEDGAPVSGAGEGEIRGLLPPEEGPVIGDDLETGRIVDLTWSGFADYAEGNFTYSFTKEGEEYRFRANYSVPSGWKVRDESLTQEEWDELMEFLLAGELRRHYVQDPELEILDGSDDGFRLTWEGMKEHEFRYEFIPEDRDAFEEWILALRDSL